MQSLKELMRNWLGVTALQLHQESQRRAIIELMASEELKRRAEMGGKASRSSDLTADQHDVATERADVGPNFHGHLGRY